MLAGRVVVVVVVVVTGGRTISGNGGVIRAGRVVEVLVLVVLVAGSRVVLVLDDVVLDVDELVVGIGSSAHAPRMSSSTSMRRVSAVIGRFGTSEKSNS